MAQWIERPTSNRKAAGSSPAVDLKIFKLYMSIAPILITVAASVLVLGSLSVLYKRSTSYWSDGTKIVYASDAIDNINEWANRTRNEFKGGRRKKYTKKHK